MVDHGSLPAYFGHAVVAGSLRCRQCGYELRGLRADSQCPECGLSIWASVQHATDPEGGRLPRLRNPKRVGNALFWLVVAWTAAAALWVIRPGLDWLEQLGSTATDRLADWAPPYPRLIAALLVLSTVWSVLRLAPPRGAMESGVVRRDIRYLLLGIVFCTLVMLELALAGPLHAQLPEAWGPGFEQALRLTGVVFALVAFVGLQGVLRVIGQRSREYRTAREGRQSVQGMLAVLVFLGLAGLLRFIPDGVWPGREGFWPNLGAVLVAIAYLMLVIGMAYLLVNAWWIRRALRRRPPTLDELLLPQLAEDTTIETSHGDAETDEPAADPHAGDGDAETGPGDADATPKRESSSGDGRLPD